MPTRRRRAGSREVSVHRQTGHRRSRGVPIILLISTVFTSTVVPHVQILLQTAVAVTVSILAACTTLPPVYLAAWIVSLPVAVRVQVRRGRGGVPMILMFVGLLMDVVLPSSRLRPSIARSIRRLGRHVFFRLLLYGQRLVWCACFRSLPWRGLIRNFGCTQGNRRIGIGSRRRLTGVRVGRPEFAVGWWRRSARRRVRCILVLHMRQGVFGRPHGRVELRRLVAKRGLILQRLRLRR